MKSKKDSQQKKEFKSKKELPQKNGDLTGKEVEGFISKLGLKKLGKDYQTIADKDVDKYIGEESDDLTKKLDKKKKINKDNKNDKKDENDSYSTGFNNSNNKKINNKFKNKIKGENKSESQQNHKFINLKQVHENVKNKNFGAKKGREGNNAERLLMQTGLWTQNEFPEDPVTFEAVTKAREVELERMAEELWKEEVERYAKRSENKGEKGGMQGWLRVMQSRGTSGDKMAAWVLLVQESNVHNLQHVEQMISLVLKHRSKSFEALETLRDLFLQVLLPDRKLRTFKQHPLGQLEALTKGSKELKAKRLIIWLFEDSLKKRYSDFIKALEILMRDNVEAVRKKATGIVLDLLCENPEEEKTLLQMLVNKLGDPSTRVSSNVIHLLNKLLLRHAAMKRVVALDVERLLYRPNVAPKAQFYAICFLGSLKLTETDSELAVKLLDIYFTFFKMYIKKGDLETKMLSALLTGINKTYTYARVRKEEIEVHAASLYKLSHMARFNTSLLALMLLYQIMDVNEKTSDRFYVALYDQLLNPELPSSSKLPLFLNLLCKAMKKDAMPRRTQAFVKRLLQVCQCFSPSMACSALYLLSEVAMEKPDVIRLEKQNEDDDEDEEEHFVDHDNDADDVEEDKMKEEQEQNDDDDLKEKSKDDSGGGDEEKKKDESGGGDGEKSKDESGGGDGEKKKVVPSWVHRNFQEFKLQDYDPLHRNPLYCRAEMHCTTELTLLLNHYHPSVAIFAQALFKGEAIDYSGDPLKDFTFRRFLDRFITKNPKQEGDQADDAGDDAREKKSVKKGDEEVGDDEDVEEMGDAEDVDFGDDLKNAFKQFDADINDELLQEGDDDDDDDEGGDDNDAGDFEELDEDEIDNEGDDDEEEEDEDMDDLFAYSDRDLKQMKWEGEGERKFMTGGKPVKRKGRGAGKNNAKKSKRR